MIGILNAHHFDPHAKTNHQEEYTTLMVNFLKESLPDHDSKNYKIALGEWPVSLDECDLWIITGSAKAAYDLDPWIYKLKSLVTEIDRQKRKLIGICFGHQVIAAALGGQVIKSPNGWGVGVKTFTVGGVESWMDPPLQSASLLFSHQDQVIAIPPGAKILAFDSFCEVQMFQIGQHILTMQGHPEYSAEYLQKRMQTRREIIPAPVYQSALDSLTKPHDEAVFKRWVRNFASM